MKKFTRIIAAGLMAAAITVSAGTMSVSAEMAGTGCDSQFLNDMGVCPDRWGSVYITFNWSEVSKAVDESWAKMGVRCVTNFWDDNKYYINGKEVTKWEAYDYVAHKLNKTYIKKDYGPVYGPGKNGHRHK